MARRNRLPEIEKEHNESLHTLIPRLLDEFGTQKAVADHLGISQATLSVWLRDNGFIAKTVYVKDTPESEAINESAT